ncbi:unnamed protein product [Arabidopsis lyrata]|uniref:Predicted protein n=1 Tax=Arabidopsis lyrata subsp. lyrata TaxID=81972 RepID=D7LKJ4_ARALL|nr:predicted protein [Arabidopsis lyrata subsp. lyrata]CAH8265870.1 unnamed protein product [Arabidopsis lyrata]
MWPTTSCAYDLMRLYQRLLLLNRHNSPEPATAAEPHVVEESINQTIQINTPDRSSM